MNTRSRFTVIALVIIVSILLVWPNFATRTVIVNFQPDLTSEEKKSAAADLKEYLKSHYPEKYSYSLDEMKNEETGELETVFKVKGNGIQKALLNEISRQPGVDPQGVKLESLWVEENLKARPFKLGLDLQGGMNLVLEADFKKLEERLRRRYSEDFFKDLNEKIEKEQNRQEKEKLIARRDQIKEMLSFTPERKKEDTRGALEIISSRINRFGVSEPLIRLQGNSRIEISLPGLASPAQAKKIISSTARVEYHLAEPGGTQGTYTRKAAQYFQEYKQLESEAERLDYIEEVEDKINLPQNYGLYAYWEKFKTEGTQLELQPSYFMVLEKEVALSGDAMSRNVFANFDSENMQNIVQFELTPAGREKFADITTENAGRQLAILIDGRIRSAPSINEPITGGSAQISGSFSPQEAQDLALIIKEGALPVPMKIVEERSVGPSLGQVSIQKGVDAILLGLLLVNIFMLVYYHAAGIVATAALVMNLLFMAGLFSLMDFTVTLPGLAGVVLTLGMAVDANVIIYERIREEIGRGKSLKAAVALGFERATWTILDSNLTTMVAAIVLASKLGAGPIKGFGVTLFVGILTSLFTSLYATRTVFYFLIYDLNLSKFPIGFGKFRKASNNTREAGA